MVAFKYIRLTKFLKNALKRNLKVSSREVNGANAKPSMHGGASRQ